MLGGVGAWEGLLEGKQCHPLLGDTSSDCGMNPVQESIVLKSMGLFHFSIFTGFLKHKTTEVQLPQKKEKVRGGKEMHST